MGVRPGGEAKCGTESGYSKHRRDGTEICRSCRDATNAANRRRRSGIYERRRLLVAVCGTEGGYMRHHRSRPSTEPCVACLVAHAAAQRKRKARRDNKPEAMARSGGSGESWASVKYNRAIMTATIGERYGEALTYADIARARGWDQ